MIAEMLRRNLRLVLQYASPFVSDKDIALGERWSAELAKELEGCNFGILCITPENVTAPWVNFEAGALSKMVNGKVTPYILGMTFAQMKGPLVQFQGAEATKIDTLEMIKAVNRNADESERLDDERVMEMFELTWPRMESAIAEASELSETAPVRRSSDDLMEEVINTVREIDFRIRDIEGRIPSVPLFDLLEDMNAKLIRISRNFNAAAPQAMYPAAGPGESRFVAYPSSSQVDLQGGGFAQDDAMYERMKDMMEREMSENPQMSPDDLTSLLLTNFPITHKTARSFATIFNLARKKDKTEP